jgi:hypothetical protein
MGRLCRHDLFLLSRKWAYVYCLKIRFFICLADHILDRIDHRIGEQGNQDRIKCKGAHGLSGVHLLILVFQGDDDHSLLSLKGFMSFRLMPFLSFFRL